jgi:Beta-lactamase class C and other penicillin binding proteins
MTLKIEIEDRKRMYGFQWWFVPYDKKKGWIFSGSGYGGQYLMVMPEYDIVVVFNGWNIFDFERPSIEYLSSRIIEAIDLNIKEVNGAN